MTTEGIRINRSTARLLSYFLWRHTHGRPVNPQHAMNAAQIGRTTFLKTVDRLKEHGWVVEGIEVLPEFSSPARARISYQLTERGAKHAAEAVLISDRNAGLMRRIGRQQRIGE